MEGLESPEILLRLSQNSKYLTYMLLGGSTSLVNLKLKRNTLLKRHLTTAAVFHIVSSWL